MGAGKCGIITVDNYYYYLMYILIHTYRQKKCGHFVQFFFGNLPNNIHVNSRKEHFIFMLSQQWHRFNDNLIVKKSAIENLF